MEIRDLNEIRIFHMDSHIWPSWKDVKKFLPLAHIFKELYQRINVYLVSTSVMEQFPQDVIPQNTIWELRMDEDFDPDKVLDKLEKIEGIIERGHYKEVPMGLYISASQFPNYIKKIIDMKNALFPNEGTHLEEALSRWDQDYLEKDSIFICYEKIAENDINDEKNNTIHFVATLFHEFSHAFMDRVHMDGEDDRKYSFYFKIIEESMADCLAASCFKDSPVQGEAFRHIFIKGKPLEYCGSYYLYEISKYCPAINLAMLWRDRNLKALYLNIMDREPYKLKPEDLINPFLVGQRIFGNLTGGGIGDEKDGVVKDDIISILARIVTVKSYFSHAVKGKVTEKESVAIIGFYLLWKYRMMNLNGWGKVNRSAKKINNLFEEAAKMIYDNIKDGKD